MSTTMTQSINRYELIKALHLHIYNFKVSQKIIFGGLDSIEKIEGKERTYLFKFQSASDSENEILTFELEYPNPIISARRTGLDSFIVVSTKQLEGLDSKQAAMYLNSPLVDEKVWKNAILLAALTPAEICVSFDKEYLDYSYHSGSCDKKIAAHVRVLLYRTGRLIALDSTFLRPDPRLFYLAVMSPNHQLVIESQVLPDYQLRIVNKERRSEWWFSEPCTDDGYIDRDDWMPKE